MTLYTAERHRATAAASPPPSRRRKLVGTAHRGPAWTNGARVLRAALLNQREHAGWRNGTSANEVGILIIDHIGELSAQSLHVLQFVLSVLVRADRQD